MFDTNPKIYKSVRDPLEQGGHPEVHTPDMLDNEDTQSYQSQIGYFHWEIRDCLSYLRLSRRLHLENK